MNKILILFIEMSSKKIGYEYIEELTAYFNEIQGIKKLTSEEEKDLSFKIKNGDKDALNKLVYHNLKFVVNIAKNYRDRGVPFSDIISEGNMGLIRAATKFDGDKNIKFISYAVWWIKNSINECIESYNRTNELLITEDFTLSNYTNADYRYDIINDDFENKINDIESRKETIDILMKCLHEREIKILTLFYGLGNNKEMTLDEVGKEMNLTNERVRQIKDTALTKLKCQVLTYSNDEIEIFKSLR